MSVSINQPAERNKILTIFVMVATILVNCDLFGEGFDVPAVECVIMLRKTESLPSQQFGRALRVIDGKLFGILIDHVGNVEWMMDKYNLNYPHDDPEWTLDRPTKKRTGTGQSRLITRVCLNALHVIRLPAPPNTYVLSVTIKKRKKKKLTSLKSFRRRKVTLLN